ncbi:hypothetical protein, partial [Carbonactinospora thermoautotrophica]
GGGGDPIEGARGQVFAAAGRDQQAAQVVFDGGLLADSRRQGLGAGAKLPQQAAEVVGLLGALGLPRRRGGDRS